MVFRQHCDAHRDEDLSMDMEKARLLGDSEYKDQRISTPNRRGKTAFSSSSGKYNNSSSVSGRGQQESFFSKFSTYGVMQLIDSIKIKNKSNRI